MLTVALALSAAGGIGLAVFGTPAAGVVLAGIVGFAAAIGRLAFESIVQRDAPEANQGRAFASFETRFQFAWAGAAFLAVAIQAPGADRAVDRRRRRGRNDGATAVPRLDRHETELEEAAPPPAVSRWPRSLEVRPLHVATFEVRPVRSPAAPQGRGPFRVESLESASGSDRQPPPRPPGDDDPTPRHLPRVRATDPEPRSRSESERPQDR